MAYKSYYASNDQAMATKPKAAGYQSFFGNTVKQAPNQQELEQQRAQKKQQEEQAKANQPKPAEPKKSTNLFGKAKKLVTDLAVDARDTAYKSANTVAAGLGSTVGAGIAVAQAAAGDKEAARKTIKSTNKTADAILDGGVGGKGGFLTSKQADSRGDGAKGLKDNYVKPTLQAASKVGQYTPTGAGKTLFGKVIKGAVDNAVIGGTTTALAGAADGGVNAKDVAKSAGTGAAFGGAFPLFGAAGKKAGSAVSESGIIRDTKAVLGKDKATNDLITQQRINSIPQAELDKAIAANPGLVETLGTPQPGAVIQPQQGPLRAKPRVEGDAASQPIVATPQHKQVVDDYIGKAHTENPVFQQGMQSLSKDLGLKYTGGPVKSADRALTKVVEDYGGDVTRLKDSVRGTLEVPDHSTGGFNKVIDTIKQKYDVVDIKDGYKNYKNGYVDMKVIVKTPGGHTAEIILATPEMLQAKNKLGGHELYEIARDTTKTPHERKAAAEQMHILYNNAHDSANKRLASSPETPALASKTDKASSGDTSSAPSTKTPTSLDEPVNTLVSRKSPSGSSTTDSTTSSGVTKNLDGERSVIPSTIAKKADDVKPDTAPTRVEDAKQTKLEQDQANPVKRAAAEADLEKIDPALAGKVQPNDKTAGAIFMDAQKAGKPITMDEARAQAAKSVDTKSGPVGSKVPHDKGNSRVYERLKAEYPDELPENVKYTEIKLKEDADRAVSLIEKDPQQAYRLAMGAETSADVTNTAVNIAMAEKALNEGNAALYARLTKNRSLAQTRRGQEIVSEKGSVTDNSTSRYVKELIASRLDKVGSKYLTNAGLVLKKNKQAAVREKAIKAIDQEVTKASKAIRGRSLDVKSAQDILDKLTCK